MGGYAKVFESILDSTVWALSKEARILWITMLVKKNCEQVVRAPLPGLAHAARLTIPETEKALKELQAPDPYSQNKEHNGKRILPVADGWFVVSGVKYRDMISKENRKEYQAAWQRNYRLEKKKKAKPEPGLAAALSCEDRGDINGYNEVTKDTLPPEN